MTLTVEYLHVHVNIMFVTSVVMVSHKHDCVSLAAIVHVLVLAGAFPLTPNSSSCPLLSNSNHTCPMRRNGTDIGCVRSRQTLDWVHFIVVQFLGSRRMEEVAHWVCDPLLEGV